MILILLHVTQTKLYELEGQVRRGAAERGADEMKKKEFEQEIQKQKDQISNIQSLYKRQLEGAENTCSQHKVHTNKTGDKKPLCAQTLPQRCCLSALVTRESMGNKHTFLTYSLLRFTPNKQLIREKFLYEL